MEFCGQRNREQDVKVFAGYFHQHVFGVQESPAGTEHVSMSAHFESSVPSFPFSFPDAREQSQHVTRELTHIRHAHLNLIVVKTAVRTVALDKSTYWHVITGTMVISKENHFHFFTFVLYD